MIQLTSFACLLNILGFVLVVNGLQEPQSAGGVLHLQTTPFTIPAAYQGQLEDYRQRWSRLTGINPSALHWNQSIIVFINQNEHIYRHNYLTYMKLLNDDYDDEDEIQFKTYTPGTILLKEHYSIQMGQPVTGLTIAMMIKREPGYAPDHGDWQYVQFSATGEVIMDGNAGNPVVKEQCASCHQNIAERDFVFHSYYARPPS
ncbi:MAG: cytochrome P460 family protein [Acidobacteriota bacterium]|nr:cytochrome P460 family protein [Acidobacteriota bacterium]